MAMARRRTGIAVLLNPAPKTNPVGHATLSGAGRRWQRLQPPAQARHNQRDCTARLCRFSGRQPVMRGYKAGKPGGTHERGRLQHIKTATGPCALREAAGPRAQSKSGGAHSLACGAGLDSNRAPRPAAWRRALAPVERQPSGAASAGPWGRGRARGHAGSAGGAPGTRWLERSTYSQGWLASRPW